MTVFGVDLSHYDAGRGPVSLPKMVAAGIGFATHKATEGTGYTDARFGWFTPHAHGVVPLVGAYHVLHTGNINAQVDHFLTVLKKAAPWWQDGPFIPQLDCEKWATDFPAPTDIEAWCHRFAALTGGSHQVVVYASRGQYGDRLLGDCPLWNAAYPSGRAAAFNALYPGDKGAGWVRYSGRMPAIWQYSSNATVGGQPGCDINAYQGTIDQLKALVWPKGGTMATTPTDTEKLAGAWYQSTQVPLINGGLGVNRAAHVQEQEHIRALEAAVNVLQQTVTALQAGSGGQGLTAEQLAAVISSAEAAAKTAAAAQVSAALRAAADAASG